MRYPLRSLAARPRARHARRTPFGVLVAHGARRALRVVTVLLASAALCLLLANFRLHETLRHAAREAGVALTYAAAYTLEPGTVHIRGLRITGGAAVLWSVDVPRLELQMSPLDVLLGRLEVDRVVGRELSIRVTGIAEDDLPLRRPERRVVALGMGPSVSRAGEPPLVRIGELQTDVRLLQLGDYRLTGQLALRAHGVAFMPNEPALGDAVLRVRGASVHKADDELLRSLDGRLCVRRTSWSSHADGEVEAPRAAHLEGSLKLTGKDGGDLLDFAGLPDPIGVLFSSVQGQPFTVATRVVQRPGAVFLQEVTAESGPFRAVGAFRDTTLDRAGVFLLTEREVSAGVLVGARDANFVVGADAAWLEQSQHLLGLD